MPILLVGFTAIYHAGSQRGSRSPYRAPSFRRLAFCRMMRRRRSSATPHSFISSKDRKQPRQVRSSSRQQFPMHGDFAVLSIPLIDLSAQLRGSGFDHTGPGESGQCITRTGIARSKALRVMIRNSLINNDMLNRLSIASRIERR